MKIVNSLRKFQTDAQIFIKKIMRSIVVVNNMLINSSDKKIGLFRNTFEQHVQNIFMIGPGLPV